MNEKKRGPFLRLLRYMKPHLPAFVLAMSLVLTMTLADLALPRLLQIGIDRDFSVFLDGTAAAFAKQSALNRVFWLAVLYLGLVGASAVLQYVQFWLFQRTGQKILFRIRKELYEHVLRLPMSFFDTHALGSLVTRVTNDTDAINEMFTTVLPSIFRNVFNFVGIVVLMYAMDIGLANAIVPLALLVAAISIVFRRAIRKVYREQRRLLSLLNTKIAENLSGMRIIQLFNRQKTIYEDFDATNRAYEKAACKEVTYFGLYRPAIEIVQALGWAALLWFGGGKFLRGVVSFGVLYAFTDYLYRFFFPILNLAETYNVIQSAMTSAGRIFALFDEEEAVDTGAIPVPTTGFSGQIEFDHVWFAYKESEWVLKDVSFTIEPGAFIAFVGATGAGKSTIMSLLCGFYAPMRGTIRVDGVDLQEYPKAQLRRTVGVVQQDVFLFSGDILSNITMHRPQVSEEDAMEAARLVNADSFIQMLPEGYHSSVVERGATLSAGQRQLLSFARTVAGRPSVLILDEATANIDTQTEQLIQSAIQSMAQKRTMIAVAHRISTIADADRIFVLHHGVLAESGTREELLQKEGLFSMLYRLQYRENGV